MASLVANDVEVGIGKASTWGTAVSAAVKIRLSQLTVNASDNDLRTRDIGVGNFLDLLTTSQRTVDVSGTAELTFGQGWIYFLAAMMGTSTGSPSENTAGQGDYLHQIDFTSTTDDYITLAFTEDSGNAIEIPTVIVSQFSIQHDAAGQGTFSFSGIGSNVVAEASATNNQAAVSALSVPATAYEMAVLKGANAYFRLNAQGGAGLGSSDDLEILNYNLSCSRPLQRAYTLRGSETPNTKLPRQAGATEGTLSVQLYEHDTTVVDALGEFLNKTEKKAEIFFDGSQIGTGDNTSLKLQFPRLYPLALPSELGFSSQQDLRQPTFNYQLLQASAAPTNMSGVTNYLRVESVDETSTSYV